MVNSPTLIQSKRETTWGWLPGIFKGQKYHDRNGKTTQSCQGADQPDGAFGHMTKPDSIDQKSDQR